MTLKRLLGRARFLVLLRAGLRMGIKRVGANAPTLTQEYSLEKVISYRTSEFTFLTLNILFNPLHLACGRNSIPAPGTPGRR